VYGLFVIFTVFASDILRVDAVHQVTVEVKQLDGANTITAIP
jgi:hypothetical protein